MYKKVWLALIFVFALAGIAMAYTYTDPPNAKCEANGTCYFGNTRWDQFGFTGDGSNLTNVNAATVDGYHMDQGVRTSDSPTFVAVSTSSLNTTVLANDINMSGYNTNYTNFNFGSTYGGSSETAPNRPFTTTQDTNISVCASGCDYTTIQEAVYTIPLILRHPFTIYIKNGTYNEDIYIPPIVVSAINGNEGSVIGLSITGQDKDGVSVNSIQVSGQTGTWATWISKMTVDGKEPTSDENVSVSIYGSTSVGLSRINFTGSVSVAIMGYGSGVYVHSSNFSGNQDYGIDIKRGGFAVFGDNYNDQSNFGSVNIAVAKGSNSFIEINSENSVTAPDLFYCTSVSSYVGVYATKLYCQYPQANNLSDTGLIAHWKFDENSTGGAISTTIHDSSKESHDGTWVGNTSSNYTTGHYSTALQFDGVDDYVNVIQNSNNALGLSNGASFAFWYKAGVLSQTGGIVGEHNSSKGLYIQHGNGASAQNTIRMALWVNTSNSTQISMTVPDVSLFHHYVFTWDKTNGMLYAYEDGWLISSTSDKGYTPFFDTTTSVEIGRFYRNSAYRYVNGTLDDIRIYNRALSQDEVRMLYYSTVPSYEEDSYTQTDNFRIVNNTGYTIANINNTGYFGTAVLPSCNPPNPVTGMTCINITDNIVDVYSDGSWRISGNGTAR